MHYYQHHIGDFIKDTANLSDHQLATYMRMIWAYYTDESPFADDFGGIAFAVRSDEETVGRLLKHYFTLADDGWHHSRCDREISAYREKGQKARNSANARWKNANALPSQTERNANEPVSDANQEPKTKNQEKKEQKNSSQQADPVKSEGAKKSKSTFTVSDLVKLGVNAQHAEDWIAVRQKKKAAMTGTALNGVIREARKAGISLAEAIRICAEKSWQGFESSWLTNQRNDLASQPINRQQQLEDANMAVAMRIAQREGLAPQQEDFIGTGETIIEGEYRYEA